MNNYKKIINLPRHEPDPLKHPRMTVYNRAAQFAPFAALTGFEEAVDETARLTSQKLQLSEEQKKTLNNTLTLIKQHLNKDHSQYPQVTVVYFEEDINKPGGTYKTISDSVQNINDFEQKLHLVSGKKIPIRDLFSVDIVA